MKIFSWMQNKLTGKQEIKKENLVATNNNPTRQDSRGEEFNDWPHGLLAIGTFGNNDNLKQKSDKSHLNGAHSTSENNLQDIAPEEVNEIQKEITNILDRQQGEGLLETFNPQKKIEDDKRNNKESSISVVLNREKDTRADPTKGSIGKKSLSFILKKMLVCRSGFSLTHGLKDPIVDKSRMEKILRAILQKKIYPQNSNPKTTAKKYLETNQLSSSDSDDDMFDAENDGSKWVKTDSDFIVLEI